jgi:hypothetical protein
MRTTSAIAITGLLSSQLLTGCFPGGCGAPSDPTNVPSYSLTGRAATTTAGTIDGVAAASDGLWVLESGASTSALVEYDLTGATERARIALGADAYFGVAWDGAHLWIGDHTPSGTIAIEMDPASGTMLHTLALPEAASDLGWKDGSLIAVEGVGDIEMYDVTTGNLTTSVQVQQLSAVDSVAYHPGEFWISQPGGTALVYADDGILAAKVEDAAFRQSVHMAFVGESLVIANGSELDWYDVSRPSAPPL